MVIPTPGDFTSRLRSPAVAARVGVLLAISFCLCLVTGLISHEAQSADPVFVLPTSPVWLYRLNQGLHVTSGIAAVPLLLVKLWSVFPKLFARPPKKVKELIVEALERGSIAALVSTSIFMLASGLANAAQWYPWDFRFRATHYAIAWIAVGSMIIHIAIKLPIIADVLRADIDSDTHDRETSKPSLLTRRNLVGGAALASAVAVVASAGSSVPWLRKVSVFGVRDGGPAGIPINKSARAANVVASALSDDYRLQVQYLDQCVEFSRKQLLDLPQHSYELPVACVEGWSASGLWTGIRMSDLLDQVGAPRGHDVRIESLQASGHYRLTTLPAHFAEDDQALLALSLNGEPLSLDHGYPCRLMVPNRPGVLQTKWVGRIEVVTT
ncbi:MAG: molybdopterin-dependent oxidoreductase [Marmoricola sp.]